jgi:hypothetical protein
MNRALLSFLLLAVCLTAGSAVAEDDTNAPAIMDLKYFQIISERNIFNPNRSGRRPTPAYVRPPRTDSFTLVGTMSYAKGSFAFFEGSSSEFRKTLKPAESIGGYKIANIEENSVTLLAASNQTITLPVGDQMKRPEGGRWVMAGHTDLAAYDSPPTADAAAPVVAPALPGSTLPAAAESDVLKRLMLKRQSEK